MILEIQRRDRQNFERSSYGVYNVLKGEEVIKEWIHLLKVTGEKRVPATLSKSLRLRFRILHP